MIRFKVANPAAEPFHTEWVDEVLGDLSVQTAARQVAELRREHPDGIISVERSSIIPRKKQAVVRFKIAEQDDLYYSVVFPAEQKDEQLARIKTKHPDAVITAEEREV